jgi:nicotinamidase/pyrazinamidase
MKTLFFDINTQIDFLFPAGALYVRGAETILSAIAQLNRHAAARSIPVISDTDAHSEDDPEFQEWPPHCVAETAGQQKAAATLLDRRIVVPSRAGNYAIEGAQQIILEKQTLDCFSNPNLRPLLEYFKADRYVVYGVAAEYSVSRAAYGLLKTGKQIDIVTDAIKSMQCENGGRALDGFAARGIRLTTISAVCS